MVVLLISIASMIALPSYQAYLIRSKVAEDFATVQHMKLGVIEYYTITGSLPTHNTQIGLGIPKTIKGVRLKKAKLTPNPQAGTIKIWFNTTKLPVLAGANRINFVPSIVNKRLRWDCNGGNLADQYRPATCRGKTNYTDSDEGDFDDE